MEGGGGRGGGDYAGLKGMRMSELGQKSKPGERGEACFSFYFGTVEPRYNETLYNEVLGITNDIFCHSYSIMYGKKTSI